MTAPALPAPLPRGYQARPGVCPFCKAAVADMPTHYSAPVKLGGCVDVAFALSDWTPYREPSTPRVKQYRPRQARHLRLGKVGYSASRRHDDGACSVKGCAEPRAPGRSMCRVHEGERRRARRAEGRND